MVFNEFVFYGFIVKAELQQALAYLKQFANQHKRLERYVSLFEEEQYISYEADAYLNTLLEHYQRYYREVFFLEKSEQCASELLRQRLIDFFGIKNSDCSLEEVETNYVATAVRGRGFQFLGGRTSGYLGPYIWRIEEIEVFEVALPEGVQTYRVKFLSDFLMTGWLDYLSLGEISAGGWTDRDGIINCVKETYDLDSENFIVSLLKHEAQHAMDLARYKQMASEDLEYRAKLVELIYSKERNLLKVFVHQARNSGVYNGHSLAAHRIVSQFKEKLLLDTEALLQLPIADIQQIARLIFEESHREVERKYLR